MTTTAIAGGVCLLVLNVIMQEWWLKKQKTLRIEQFIKLYGPQGHLERKGGTPTMGGVVFLGVALVGCFLAFCFLSSERRFLVEIWSLPFAAGLVGFVDDWLKFSHRSSEGLSSRGKFLAQIAVCLPWSLFVASQNLEFLPGFRPEFFLAAMLLTFASIGFLNAFNVTDGLDGLAAGAAVISFTGLLALGDVEKAVSWAGMTGLVTALGFLWHNAHPAKIFMGDVGAHFFGGLLMSTAIFSGTPILVVPLSFLFLVEITSVILQILAIRGFQRRIFRMSPLHHHFELMGWSETQIVARFWIVHVCGMLATFVLLKFLLFR